MTFELYLERSARRKSLHPSERMGQAYFNQLREDQPEVASDVTNSEIDPFYDDNLIGEFLTYLSVVWQD